MLGLQDSGQMQKWALSTEHGCRRRFAHYDRQYCFCLDHVIELLGCVLTEISLGGFRRSQGTIDRRSSC